MPALQEKSGPLFGIAFTDDEWQTIFGSNAGIVGDTDGSAYALTLPPGTDTVELGSPTIDSRSVVGGYGHLIPAGTTQSLAIPASTNPTVGRTDLIVARLNTATFTTDPGPVRLVRIAGTEGSATPPSHNTTLPSPVDLVLYQITRKQGDGLNQATVVDRRPRSGWNYLVPGDSPLPQTAPLGSRVTRGGIIWRREFDGPSVQWVEESRDRVVLTGTDVASDGDDYEVRSASRLSRKGVERWMNFVVALEGDPVNPGPDADGERRVGRLDGADWPAPWALPGSRRTRLASSEAPWATSTTTGGSSGTGQAPPTGSPRAPSSP
jgi:hypothetical protein